MRACSVAVSARAEHDRWRQRCVCAVRQVRVLVVPAGRRPHRRDLREFAALRREPPGQAARAHGRARGRHRPDGRVRRGARRAAGSAGWLGGEAARADRRALRPAARRDGRARGDAHPARRGGRAPAQGGLARPHHRPRANFALRLRALIDVRAGAGPPEPL